MLIGIFIFTLSCTNRSKESQKYIREGNIYLYGSNIERAYELFQKAARLNPENEEAWYGIAMTWINKMQYRKAIENFDKAIALNPVFMDAYYNRGQAWFYLGENYNACDDWKKAYELGKANMEDKLKKCR